MPLGLTSTYTIPLHHSKLCANYTIFAVLGNSEERLVYERALRQLQPHLPRYTRSLPRPGAESDVVLEIHMPDDDALIGSTIQIRAVAKNNSFERSHTLRLLLRAISKCYTGCNERLLRQRIFHETLEPRDCTIFLHFEMDVIILAICKVM